MVRKPMRMKMCVIPGPKQSRSNAALTIDLVVCEKDEVCVPFYGSPFPWPKENNMNTAIKAWEEGKTGRFPISVHDFLINYSWSYQRFALVHLY